MQTLDRLIADEVCGQASGPRSSNLQVFDRLFEFPLDALSISVTSRCNFRCRYCYVDFNSIPDMSFDLYRGLIDEAVTALGIVQVSLTGGECLLLADLPERAAYAAEKGCRVTVLTNGYLLVPEAIDDLAGAGVQRLAVSFDTDDPESFASLTQSKDGYDRVLENLAHARERGLHIVIGAVLLKGINDSPQSLEALESRMGEIGITGISCTPLFPFGPAADLRQFVLEPRAVASLWSRNLARTATPPTWRTPEFLDEPSDAPISYHDLYGRDVCDLAKGMMHILPDGGVIPCPALPEIKIGRFQSYGDLTEIWTNSGVVQDLRNETCTIGQACNTCEVYEWCHGGCRARAYHDQGKFDAPDRWACAINRQAFAANRRAAHGTR